MGDRGGDLDPASQALRRPRRRGSDRRRLRQGAQARDDLGAAAAHAVQGLGGGLPAGPGLGGGPGHLVQLSPERNDGRLVLDGKGGGYFCSASESLGQAAASPAVALSSASWAPS